MNISTIVKGMRNISVKATSRSIFLDWNSTSDINSLAPHHEFWPSVCKV